jgi:ferrous iron transport protein A
VRAGFFAEFRDLRALIENRFQLDYGYRMNLGDVPAGSTAAVTQVGGDRAFRRRLMELGLLPGTRVEVVRIAPLGDPIELQVRGCLLSIRREEASRIAVSTASEASRVSEPGSAASVAPRLPASP